MPPRRNAKSSETELAHMKNGKKKTPVFPNPLVRSHFRNESLALRKRKVVPLYLRHKPKTPISFPLFFHIMHNDPVVNTITTIVSQLDELPTITPGAIIPGIQIVDPDGAGTGTTGAGSRGKIPLILTR